MKEPKFLLKALGKRALVTAPFAGMLGLCLIMSCCDNRKIKDRARETAQNCVEFTCSDDPQLKILAVGMADSVIDGIMFSQQEQQFLMKLLSETSNDVFATLYGEDDPDVLLEKFNKATTSSFDTSALAQEMMMQSVRQARMKPSGRLTGWRVTVNYETVIDGTSRKMSRWCYLDPSGVSVVKSFDIPMK